VVTQETKTGVILQIQSFHVSLLYRASITYRSQGRALLEDPQSSGRRLMLGRDGEGQLSATLPAETAHDPWLARYLAPVHLWGKVSIRGVVLPALWALCGLCQPRTEPARVPECSHPLPGSA
jgi:hypothetical protein